MSAVLDFWRSPAGLDYITPAGKAWPEGDRFSAFLASLIGESSVLEFGCGPGRLAGCFDPDRYVGVDVSEHAIAAARRANPSHRFAVIGEVDPLPPADVTLAHTVLLHVPDEALPGVVARFESETVIVSEILGRHWRRQGNPPVFNRDLSDYGAAFLPRYRIATRQVWPYPHYADTNLSVMRFGKIQ